MTACTECSYDWGGPPEHAVLVIGDFPDHLSRLLLDALRGTCASVSAQLAALTATAWERDGTGSDGSGRTIAQLADRAGHEAQHHLRDIALGLDAPGRGQIQ